MLSWFQTFAVFWMLYAFFWVIPRRLNFICQRFGTRCLFHLHRRVGMKNFFMKMEQTECFETLAYKFQTPGNYPEESIRHDIISCWTHGYLSCLYIINFEHTFVYYDRILSVTELTDVYYNSISSVSVHTVIYHDRILSVLNAHLLWEDIISCWTRRCLSW